MSLIRIRTDPSRTELAIFAVAWAVFFAVLGGCTLGTGGRPAVAGVLWGVGITVPAAGWVAPRFLRWVYVGLSCLGFPAGFVVSHAILAGIYYLVLTPLGVLLRLLGHDPLGRRADDRAESYWVPRKPDEGLRRYFRQF